MTNLIFERSVAIHDRGFGFMACRPALAETKTRVQQRTICTRQTKKTKKLKKILKVFDGAPLTNSTAAKQC